MTPKRHHLFVFIFPQLLLLLSLCAGPIQAAESLRRSDSLFRFERQIPIPFSDSHPGKPTCLAIDSTGRLFVTCSLINEVRVFDPSGQFLFAFGGKTSAKKSPARKTSPAEKSSDNKSPGKKSPDEKSPGEKSSLSQNQTSLSQDQTRKGVLFEPSGIAIDQRDRIYVSDLALDTVSIYDPDGVFQDQFPIYQPKAEEKGRNACAPFISCNPADNLLYIPDACNHLVGVYSLKGEYKDQFGTSGSEEGKLSGPAHIAFDSKGNIYIVDAGNYRIQSFTPGFRFRFAFGRSGTGEGEFIRAYDVAVDDKDRIYVSDFILNSVQVFNQKGEYLDSLRQADDSKTFSQPLGLAYAKNKVYVVNAETKVVSVFDVSR
ncbi:MAG: NHL repeat-containing protein [bacterium]